MTADIFKRFIRRKASLIGGIILLLFLLMALIGPFLCTQDPNAQDIANKYAPPSWEHLLGTDNLGRDTLTRMVYGARVSLLVSFVGTIIGSAIGVALGVLAGYYGGWLDSLISRFVDFLLAFPGLLLAIVVVAILGSGLENTMAAIAFYSIPYIARMVRGVVLTLKGSEYVQACKVMGVSDARIIMTHIIPNSMSQIIVNVTLNLGTAILTASSLSFLGLGVTPPNPEWGAMLSTARDAIRSYPWAAVIPGVALGLASGRSPALASLLSPIINGVRAVPGISWLPLALLWLGIGFRATVFLIALAGFFPAYLNAAAGAASVPPVLIRAGRMLGFGRRAIFFRVVIPSAMPQVRTGLRVALGMSFSYLVLGELTGVPDGLGAMIMDARLAGRVDLLVSGIILIALVGWLCDVLLMRALSAVSVSLRRQ